YVFAHVVQGNSQNYTREQWELDMKVAQEAHIDAFAINIGTDPSNDQQLPMIYEVAEEVGFKVFISFDMNYYAYNDSSKDIISRTLQFSKRKSQFKYKGKVFLSTFSGEVPGTFMNGNPNYTSAWCTLKASLRGHGVDTYFVPGWTGIEPSTSRCADGLLSWDAWPHVSNDIPSSDQLTYNVTIQESLYFPDKAAMKAARAVSKTFMAPVSPFFFKHLDSSTADNYIYRGDDWMMVNRYTKLIQQKQKPEFIELLTWNDYGESHYLRDPQPSANLPIGAVSAHQYVDGFSHSALLEMLSYFNQWYKNGKPPVIEKTKLYVWYRPHVKTAVATADVLPVPAYANLTEDRIYGYVIPAPNTTVFSIRVLSGYQVLEQPLFQANLTQRQLSKNSSELCEIYEDRSTNNEVELDGTGILISAPFEPGTQRFELLDKSGQTLASLDGLEVTVTPNTYNFNYWSASIS
ncbi:glycosyl hydrolase family 71-domain-containing protein, partial [Phakopsora pachyrhizi]